MERSPRGKVEEGGEKRGVVFLFVTPQFGFKLSTSRLALERRWSQIDLLLGKTVGNGGPSFGVCVLLVAAFKVSWGRRSSPWGFPWSGRSLS